MGDLIERIAQLKRQGRTFCVVTVVDSSGATPRKAGAKGIVFPDGSIEGTVGGGNIELQAIQTASEAIQSKQPLLKKFDLEALEVGGMICGGSMTLFFEPIYPDRMLTIFGGGHVGRALARVAHEAGWKIRVIDERAGVLDPTVFPDGAELLCEDYMSAIQKLIFSLNDWIVIVTPKHSHDEQVLAAVIDVPAAYIGMMGSPKKVKQVMENLKAKGIPDEKLEKVFAPIGLNIASESPGEIAISIVAEMLAVLNQIKQIKSFSLKEEH